MVLSKKKMTLRKCNPRVGPRVNCCFYKLTRTACKAPPGQVQAENQSWWAIEVLQLRDTIPLHPALPTIIARCITTARQFHNP